MQSYASPRANHEIRSIKNELARPGVYQIKMSLTDGIFTYLLRSPRRYEAVGFTDMHMYWRVVIYVNVEWTYTGHYTLTCKVSKMAVHLSPQLSTNKTKALRLLTGSVCLLEYYVIGIEYYNILEYYKLEQA